MKQQQIKAIIGIKQIINSNIKQIIKINIFYNNTN